MCTNLLLWAPAGANFCWWPVRSGGSFSWLGQRCCCVLLHGRERLELHDLLRLRDQKLNVIPVGSQNSWEIFVVSSATFSSSGQEPGQPIAFGDDKGRRRLEQPPRLSLGPGRFFFLSVSHCRNRSGPLGTPSQKAHCVALSGPVRWWRSGRSPMICAGRGATVAIVQPERDSFAGGACANPSFQYLYLISRSASAGGRCRGGGPANGRLQWCGSSSAECPHHGTLLLEQWTRHLACAVWTTAG
jgi:hypothetical protein